MVRAAINDLEAAPDHAVAVEDMSPISAMRESFRIFDMAASRTSRDGQTI